MASADIVEKLLLSLARRLERGIIVTARTLRLEAVID